MLVSELLPYINQNQRVQFMYRDSEGLYTFLGEYPIASVNPILKGLRIKENGISSGRTFDGLIVEVEYD